MNMSQELKKECLGKLRVRYLRRSREGKSRMLDELCEDYQYERKYAIKLLRDVLPVASGRARPGPEPRYGMIEPVVRQMWQRPNNPAASVWCRSCGSGCPTTKRATAN